MDLKGAQEADQGVVFRRDGGFAEEALRGGVGRGHKLDEYGLGQRGEQSRDVHKGHGVGDAEIGDESEGQGQVRGAAAGQAAEGGVEVRRIQPQRQDVGLRLGAGGEIVPVDVAVARIESHAIASRTRGGVAVQSVARIEVERQPGLKLFHRGPDAAQSPAHCIDGIAGRGICKLRHAQPLYRGAQDRHCLCCGCRGGPARAPLQMQKARIVAAPPRDKLGGLVDGKSVGRHTDTAVNIRAGVAHSQKRAEEMAAELFVGGPGSCGSGFEGRRGREAGHGPDELHAGRGDLLERQSGSQRILLHAEGEEGGILPLIEGPFVGKRLKGNRLVESRERGKGPGETGGIGTRETVLGMEQAGLRGAEGHWYISDAIPPWEFRGTFGFTELLTHLTNVAQDGHFLDRPAPRGF